MSTAVDRGFETWRCNLLAHRYNELGAACRADRELYSEDVRSELEQAAWHLERLIEHSKLPVWHDAETTAVRGHLFEAEHCVEKAERLFLAQRARVVWHRSPAYAARCRFMYQFIETLRLHIPPIHPCGEEAVYSYFAEMRDATDDPPEVARVAAMIRDRVVQELRFEAESIESSRCPGCYRDAYRLRRQADRFDANHRFEELAHV